MTGTLSKPTPSRLFNAVGLRLAAAWMVLLGHSPALLGQPSGTGPAWGHIGLGIFFSLSGYMVSLSATRSRGWADFFHRRIRRLVPAYIFISLAIVLVFWPLFSRAGFVGFRHPIHLARFWLRMLASGAHWELPGLFSSHAFTSANGSLWSLPYEGMMYLALGVLWFAVLRRWERWRLAVPALLWASSLLLLSGGDGLLPDGDFRIAGFRIHYLVLFLGFFAGGWTLAFLRPSNRTVFLLAGLAIAIRIPLSLLPDSNPGLALDAALFPLLVVAIGRIPLPGLERLPDWSYGFYLWAWPVQQSLIEIRPGLSSIALTGLATLFTLPLAALSWRWVEKPWLVRFRESRRPAASTLHLP